MARPSWSVRSTGWVPFALIALVLVPAAAGALRLIELAGGPLLIPENARMAASPGPVVVHIASALPYAVLGAFQFSRRVRRRWPVWHRAAGRVLVVLGLAVAFSALCMTQFFTQGIGHAVFGVSELSTDLMLGAGWALNLMAAEFIIRSGGHRTGRRTGEARIS